MKLTEEMIEQLKADLAKAKTMMILWAKMEQLKKLIAKSLEQMLESELTEEHLVMKNIHQPARTTVTAETVKPRKTLKNDNGEIEITVPQ